MCISIGLLEYIFDLRRKVKIALVLTLDAQDSYYIDEGKTFEIIVKVKPIDTTVKRDSHVGPFVYGLSKGIFLDW